MKDIKKEFVNEHTKLSMKFSVSCKGVYAGDYDKALWKLIKKQLNSNTKRVKKEMFKEIEKKMSGGYGGKLRSGGYIIYEKDWEAIKALK